MLNYLKQELRKTKTLNNADAFTGTGSAVLNLFSRGANLRTDYDALEELIAFAFDENVELTLRTLFYLSDIRCGQGTRDVMKTGIKYLVEKYPQFIENLMPLFVEYNRWDMLYEFVGTEFEKMAFQTMYKAAYFAYRTENYLIFKWLKSADASSQKTRKLGRLTAQYFGMSEKEYRKFLTAGRKKLNLVENNLTHKTYNKINYEQVPSKASLLYREAFYRHDGERYSDYLDQVMSGEKKMNMSVTYPHEIVAQYGKYDNRKRLDLEAAWKSLPNYIKETDDNILVVCDTSGSMGLNIRGSSVQAIDVSIALAIYTAEKNQGFFHNHFITFSERPELIQLLKIDSLRNKIDRVYRTNWGYNTDIDRVFELILNTAVQNHLSQRDMPGTILIVSDMQFDEAIRGGRNFENWKQNFANHNYGLPKIVFWNVMDYGNVPVDQHDNDAVLISGFSPTILEFIYTGNITTPYELMLKVINTPRYDVVINAVKNIRSFG